MYRIRICIALQLIKKAHDFFFQGLPPVSTINKGRVFVDTKTFTLCVVRGPGSNGLPLDGINWMGISISAEAEEKGTLNG